MSTATDALARLTSVTPDFPSPGILFRDLTPVFADPEALRAVAEELVEGSTAEAIAGIEARGFVLAAAAAVATGRGAIVVRKAGKLPPPTVSREYALEYGTATLELSLGVFRPGTRVVVVDDVLATGGTMRATVDLLREAGLEVEGVAVAIELAALGGRAKLPDVPVRALSVID
jgi:adenine phosphoribosyltransferase